MFSELCGLAETSVSQTEAPVNTPAGLACLAVAINIKLTLSWNNHQFYSPYVTNLLLLSNVLKEICRTQHTVQDLTGYMFRTN
jgi:hypothetical protein